MNYLTEEELLRQNSLNTFRLKQAAITEANRVRYTSARCARCGLLKGEHLTESARRGNPRACPFIKKHYINF